jgi:hypothetical protein
VQPDPSVRGKYLRPDSESDVVGRMWQPITFFPEGHFESKTIELVVFFLSIPVSGNVVHQAMQ